MNGYTDFLQSHKLAEILPIESADMYYGHYDMIHANTLYAPSDAEFFKIREITPCWSMASLLNVLPKVINHETLFIETSPALWHIGYRNVYTARKDNLVDACYEMILKLHELNLLCRQKD